MAYNVTHRHTYTRTHAHTHIFTHMHTYTNTQAIKFAEKVARPINRGKRSLIKYTFITSLLTGTQTHIDLPPPPPSAWRCGPIKCSGRHPWYWVHWVVCVNVRSSGWNSSCVLSVTGCPDYLDYQGNVLQMLCFCPNDTDSDSVCDPLRAVRGLSHRLIDV